MHTAQRTAPSISSGSTGTGTSLVVSIDEPHHPHICPEPFASAFEDFYLPVGSGPVDSLTGKPHSQLEWSEHDRDRPTHLRVQNRQNSIHHPRYFACNSFSDHEVGRVLAAVNAETPEALVTYTGDHGDMLGEHGIEGKGPVMYDQITTIPLIVRWPGQGRTQAICRPPVSHIDLTPTFLDFFGVAVPPLLHGVSLLPAVRDPECRLHSEIFIEFHRFEIDHDGFGAFAPIRCACDGRYKLAVNLLETDEFYDLEADPGELNNLIGDVQAAPARDRLHDAILEWMNTTRDPLRGPHWARRPWRSHGGSTWRGPTRPRPFDPQWAPTPLLYETGREIERFIYDKT